MHHRGEKSSLLEEHELVFVRFDRGRLFDRRVKRLGACCPTTDNRLVDPSNLDRMRKFFEEKGKENIRCLRTHPDLLDSSTGGYVPDLRCFVTRCR